MDDLWHFDPASMARGIRWREVTPEGSPRPGPRLCAASAVVGDEYLLFGGWDMAAKKTLDDVWAFDISGRGRGWREVGTLPEPAKNHVAVAVGADRCVVHTERCVGSVLVYDAEEGLRRVPTSGDGPSKRTMQAGAPVGDASVFIFGGGDARVISETSRRGATRTSRERETSEFKGVYWARAQASATVSSSTTATCLVQGGKRVIFSHLSRLVSRSVFTRFDSFFGREIISPQVLEEWALSLTYFITKLARRFRVTSFPRSWIRRSGGGANAPGTALAPGRALARPPRRTRRRSLSSTAAPQRSHTASCLSRTSGPSTRMRANGVSL